MATNRIDRSARFRLPAVAAALALSVSLLGAAPGYAAASSPSGQFYSAASMREAVNSAGLSELKKATRILKRARNTARAAVEIISRAADLQASNPKQAERLFQQASGRMERAVDLWRSAEQSRLAADDAHAANESRLIESGRSPVTSDAWFDAAGVYAELLREVEGLTV